MLSAGPAAIWTYAEALAPASGVLILGATEGLVRDRSEGQSDTGGAVENGVLDDPTVAQYFADVTVGCGSGLSPAAYLFPFFRYLNSHCIVNDVAVVPLTTDFDEVLGTYSSVDVRLFIVPITAVTRGTADLSFVVVNTRHKRQLTCSSNLPSLLFGLVVVEVGCDRGWLWLGLVVSGVCCCWGSFLLGLVAVGVGCCGGWLLSGLVVVGVGCCLGWLLPWLIVVRGWLFSGATLGTVQRRNVQKRFRCALSCSSHLSWGSSDGRVRMFRLRYCGSPGHDQGRVRAVQVRAVLFVA